MINQERFWTKSYDEHVHDLDPSLWDTTFTHALRQTFDTIPDNLALEFLGVELTFGELDYYSNKFAHMLLESGFRKGDTIGLNLVNTPQYIIALLGAMKIGLVVTGVSPLLSEDQLVYQLTDSETKVLVTLDAVFEKRLIAIIDRVPLLKMIITTNVGDFLPKFKQILGKLIKKIPTGKIKPIEGKDVKDFMKIIKDKRYDSLLPGNDLTPDDLAYILYTGGATGPPKGAMLTHRSIVADLVMVQTWLSWERGAGVALSGFPFFHVAGIFFCENCLYLGWPQLLVVNPRDTDHMCSLYEKYEVTALVNVPSLFQMLFKNPKFQRLDHSSLDTCISSASPFPVESQKELESLVGENKLLEVYGMTECSPLSTMNPYRGKKKLGSIGLPLMNTDIKLVDPITGEKVEIGQAGEICVKGPQVMKGYWKKPEETANTIDKDGYLHTGDVAIFDEDGYLRIVDRTKDMIIVGGFKVFSNKLENTLTEHPAIEMVATIGVPNPERPGSEYVKAYLTVTPKYSSVDKSQLKSEIANWAKEKVAPYEVPKFIEIREELPLTLVGKVDKKELRAENQ